MATVRPGPSETGVLLGLDDQQGFCSASGVVLSRRILGEGDLYLTLFLKGIGMTFASVRGGAGGKVRFGGGTEPLMWGSFKLYKSKSGASYLKSADVADDMLRLRGRADALFAVIRWVKLLMRRLMEGHPADDLLANLYWSMKLLDEGRLSIQAAEWRFLWRWLKSWGLAPDLRECVKCSDAEREFLYMIAAAKVSNAESFVPVYLLDANTCLFTDAVRSVERFLEEI